VLGLFQDKADATEKWLEAEGKQRISQSQIERLNLKKQKKQRMSPLQGQKLKLWK
jgi:hypothetical protein